MIFQGFFKNKLWECRHVISVDRSNEDFVPFWIEFWLPWTCPNKLFAIQTSRNMRSYFERDAEIVEIMWIGEMFVFVLSRIWRLPIHENKKNKQNLSLTGFLDTLILGLLSYYPQWCPTSLTWDDFKMMTKMKYMLIFSINECFNLVSYF